MDTIGRNYKLSPSGDSKITADLQFSDTMSQVIKLSFTSFTPHLSQLKDHNYLYKRNFLYKETYYI